MEIRNHQLLKELWSFSFLGYFLWEKVHCSRTPYTTSGKAQGGFANFLDFLWLRPMGPQHGLRPSSFETKKKESCAVTWSTWWIVSIGQIWEGDVTSHGSLHTLQFKVTWAHSVARPFSGKFSLANNTSRDQCLEPLQGLSRRTCELPHGRCELPIALQWNCHWANHMFEIGMLASPNGREVDTGTPAAVGVTGLTLS